MENEKKYTEYDLHEIYENELYPEILKIKQLCKLRDIPFLMSFAVSNRDGKTEYKNEGVLTGSSGLHLYDDQFKRMVLILRGASVSPIGRIEFNEEDMAYITDSFDETDVFKASMHLEALDECDAERIEELSETLPEKKRRGRPPKINVMEATSKEEVVEEKPQVTPSHIENKTDASDLICFVGDI